MDQIEYKNVSNFNQFEVKISELDLKLIYEALKHYSNCAWRAEQTSVDIEVIKDRTTYFYGKLNEYRSKKS